ncbi:MAG: helix-turn-helix transcriptional regulator [Nitrospirae bacterium]|nr:helix-turn-helix transcriptional regulator [Candidatus Manganitrophaceae bacterium]
MDYFYREFGRILRQRRKAAGFTQDEVSARVGLSRTSITNIEQGRQHISLHMLYELADAIGSTPGELLPDRLSLVQQSSELEKKLGKLSVPEDEKDWIRRLVSKTNV